MTSLRKKDDAGTTASSAKPDAMSKETVEKYIQIGAFGVSASGLTKVWVVRNKRSNEDCGRIRWCGAFRKYAFYPSEGFLFDADCLRFIADFIDNTMVWRKKNKA